MKLTRWDRHVRLAASLDLEDTELLLLTHLYLMARDSHPIRSEWITYINVEVGN